MLMKLTPGVNFINILGEIFSYKSTLHSFYLMTVWLCNFFGKIISAQKLLLNGDEIDYRGGRKSYGRIFILEKS